MIFCSLPRVVLFALLLSFSLAFNLPGTSLRQREFPQPGSPEFNCHAACGGLIDIGKQDTQFCDQDDFKADYKLCMECALSYDKIWEFYGSHASEAIKKCNLPINLSSSGWSSLETPTPTPTGTIASSSMITTSEKASSTNSSSNSTSASGSKTEQTTTATTAEKSTSSVETGAKGSSTSETGKSIMTTTAGESSASKPTGTHHTTSTNASGTGHGTNSTKVAVPTASSSAVPKFNNASTIRRDFAICCVLAVMVWAFAA